MPPLTPRETEIVLLIAPLEGYSSQNIAARLGISYRTVGAHTANIFRKLNVHARAYVVAYAFRAGMIQ
jgi:DNA-binding CsgD family transcriptional regulator